MKSFEEQNLGRLTLTHGLIRTIRLLGEFKGTQTLYRQQSPQALEALRDAAVIQSVESSNRIEGVVAPIGRIQSLMAGRTTPQNRSEQEIAGYRDVLNLIHGNWEHIRLTPGVVLQLHRDLMQYTPAGGGRWKAANNQITETGPDGTVRVRFEPAPAHLTGDMMERLHAAFHRTWQAEVVDRLLLIPAYVLDFLCIHPFADGNGRMARLLTLLLLYQAGYEVGRYVSLERIIEQAREGYYESLRASSEGWHEGRHELGPWTEYLLGVIVRAYREFEERTGKLAAARGVKTEMVLAAIRNLPDGFRISDIERLCPTVSREMIRAVLRKLRDEVWSEGSGPAAVWRKRRQDE